MKAPNINLAPEYTALLERVKQAKRINRLTIARIAETAGMNRPTVTNQLNGRFPLDIRVLLALAKLCDNVSAEYLLRGDGDIIKSGTAAIDKDPGKSVFSGRNLEEILHTTELRLQRLENAVNQHIIK